MKRIAKKTVKKRRARRGVSASQAASEGVPRPTKQVILDLLRGTALREENKRKTGLCDARLEEGYLSDEVGESLRRGAAAYAVEHAPMLLKKYRDLAEKGNTAAAKLFFELTGVADALRRALGVAPAEGSEVAFTAEVDRDLFEGFREVLNRRRANQGATDLEPQRTSAPGL